MDQQNSFKHYAGSWFRRLPVISKTLDKKLEQINGNESILVDVILCFDDNKKVKQSPRKIESFRQEYPEAFSFLDSQNIPYAQLGKSLSLVAKLTKRQIESLASIRTEVKEAFLSYCSVEEAENYNLKH